MIISLKILDKYTVAILAILVILLITNMVLVMSIDEICSFNSSLIGVSEKSEILKILGITVGGFLLMIQANVATRRIRSSENGLKQERLKNAIEHLGSEKSAIRIGGLHELYHLAKEESGFRETISDIICSFVKDFTTRANYLVQDREKCSIETQTAIDLLFNDDIFKSNRKYLSDSDLRGVSFFGKKLIDVRFHNSLFKQNNFSHTDLNSVWFFNNNLTKTYFTFSKIEKCNFRNCDGIDRNTFSWKAKISNTTFENIVKSLDELGDDVELKNVKINNR